MPALSLDRERIVLFAAGIVATIACVVFYRYGTVQEYAALLGQPALAGAIGRIGSNYGRVLAPFFGFLAFVVLRPSPANRYFNIVFWVWFGAIVLTSVMDGDLHPSSRASRQTGSVTSRASRPEDTMENWARIVNDTAAAVKKEAAAYDAEMKAADTLQTTDMLTDPEQAAARLQNRRRTVRQHRAGFAKIIADGRAGLEAEQQRTGPSPLLKMHAERMAHQGETIDRDLAQYDRILAEFQATLRDLIHAQGQIKAHDGKIYFSAPQDHDTYSRHMARINRLDEERRAAQKAAVQPH
ncbi:MAG TPA: hypothetical protein VH189_08945 [Rhizomicrobium sp.]|nr:hypothetical protein [Rhizomicrobium sp.]